MNAPARITPTTRDMGANIYADPKWLGNYNGVSLFKLTNGLIWSLQTGCFENVAEAQASIDEWRDQLNADTDSGEMDWQQP